MRKTLGLRDPATAFPLGNARDDAGDRRAANRAVEASAAGLGATGLAELLLAVLTGSVGLLGGSERADPAWLRAFITDDLTRPRYGWLSGVDRLARLWLGCRACERCPGRVMAKGLFSERRGRILGTSAVVEPAAIAGWLVFARFAFPSSRLAGWR